MPGGKGLRRGPGSPPAAADQPDFDHAAAGRVGRRAQADLPQERTADECGSGLEKVASGGRKGVRGGWAQSSSSLSAFGL